VSTILDPNSRLFVLARQGLRQPSALMAIAVLLVTYVLIIVGQLVANRVLAPIFPGGTESISDPLVQGGARLLSDAINFLPAYLCVWAGLALFSKRPFWTLGFEKDRAVSRAVRAALIALLMVTAVTAVLALLPGTTLAPGQFQTVGPIALGGGFLTLLAFVVQSSGEEVLFRGWLLAVIGARYRPWIGLLVSSLLFSLAHAINPLITPLALLNLFLFGAFASLCALSEGGLWGACAWHAVWNWTQYDVFAFPLSGGHSPALLTSVHAAGRDMITGGAWGPDAGLPATAVLLIGIGFVLVRTHRDARQEKIRRRAPH
jgi:membrane protease YdiL (CAAX protease family)